MSNRTVNVVKREGYFARLRNRWKRRGVVEIDESHAKHTFTMYVRKGLQDSVVTPGECKEDFTDDDFKQKVVRHLESPDDKTKFEVVTYAPNVFESLRERVGMSPEIYGDCICPAENDVKYLEFVSNSKSGQNFFLSNDKRLMIKTHTGSEKKFFLKILPRYIQHLKRFPHSLLVKYLGLYKITISKHEPVYFIVMQSILYPDERIDQRYDLKACQAGRFTEIPEEHTEVISVLKDMNFGERKILLGSQRSWFSLQIQHDTEFLRSIAVIDYSLLIGMQTLLLEEIKENKELASIFVRAKKSTSRQHSVLKNWAQSPTRGLKSQMSTDSVVSQTSSEPNDSIHLPGTVPEEGEGSVEESASSKERSGTGSPKVTSYGRSDSGERSTDSPVLRPSVTEAEIIAQNRRLLPQCRNELHVIDGSGEERYFVGIIDFFTPFGFKKRCESAMKAVRYKPHGISYSTVHPDAYAARFLKFVNEHIG